MFQFQEIKSQLCCAYAFFRARPPAHHTDANCRPPTNDPILIARDNLKAFGRHAAVKTLALTGNLSNVYPAVTGLLLLLLLCALSTYTT